MGVVSSGPLRTGLCSETSDYSGVCSEAAAAYREFLEIQCRLALTKTHTK